MGGSAKKPSLKSSANLANPTKITGKGISSGFKNANLLKPQKTNFDYGPSISRPEQITYGTNPLDKSGQLKSSYQVKPAYSDPIQADSRGMDAFRTEALRTGPSAWLNNQLEQQKIQEAQNNEDSSQMASGQNAQARSALAMKGGLTSGASERLAGSGARNQLLERQKNSRAGEVNRLGLQSTDESNRLDTLGKLPGMETAWIQPQIQQSQYNATNAANADVYNTNNRLGVQNNQRQFNQDQYGQGMQEWADAQQAKAIGKQGERKGPSKWFYGVPGTKA